MKKSDLKQLIKEEIKLTLNPELNDLINQTSDRIHSFYSGDSMGNPRMDTTKRLYQFAQELIKIINK